LLGKKFIAHPEMLLDQIRQVDDEISPLMPPGSKFYFRAPYGSWRSPHAAVLNADPVLKKYVGPIYWDEGGDITFSADGYVISAADWDCWHRKWDADTCAKGYMREIRRKNGGVVLMHCIHRQSGELVGGCRAGAGGRGLYLRPPRPGSGDIRNTSNTTACCHRPK
jgi:peptidoglycan/xylan/chitin deacetylase (PgdA/CDA1 family)